MSRSVCRELSAFARASGSTLRAEYAENASCADNAATQGFEERPGSAWTEAVVDVNSGPESHSRAKDDAIGWRIWRMDYEVVGSTGIEPVTPTMSR